MSRQQLSGTISYRPEGQGLNQVHRWRAFAVLAVSFFMTIADLAIVNVALPTIGRDLHMAESSLQWVVTGYALTFGGFLLLGGRSADLLGRRRILMAGLALFTAASLGCGLATAEGFLIAMRFLQGLGAARNQHHVVAGLGEPPRQLVADALRAAGDDHHGREPRIGRQRCRVSAPPSPAPRLR